MDTFDAREPLVIDPAIVYSTLLGGGLGATQSYSVAVDSFGNILLAGRTYAADFPVASAAQNTFNSFAGFVAKINSAGTGLVYSTWLAGSGDNSSISSVAVDSTGAAWITGTTASGNFPVLNAAQPSYGGGVDAIVAKLDANGALQFSSYLGGSSNDTANGIAVDGSGSGYVTGYTSGSFPVTPGTLPAPTSSTTAFVTKYTPSGSIAWSTLLGGNNGEVGNAVAVDSGGNAYVAGYTYSTAFNGAPAGGAQSTNNGGGDAFVAKLNANATALLYFTFLGGPSLDIGSAIAVDSSGNARIAGQTSSTGIATPGAAQTVLAGGTNAFAAELNPSGSAFTYVTYLGGNHADYLTSMAVDPSGNVYLAGKTNSPNFPVVSPLQTTLPANGTSLLMSADSGATWAAFDSNMHGVIYGISPDPAGTSDVALTDSGDIAP